MKKLKRVYKKNKENEDYIKIYVTYEY